MENEKQLVNYPTRITDTENDEKTGQENLDIVVAMLEKSKAATLSNNKPVRKQTERDKNLWYILKNQESAALEEETQFVNSSFCSSVRIGEYTINRIGNSVLFSHSSGEAVNVISSKFETYLSKIFGELF